MQRPDPPAAIGNRLSSPITDADWPLAEATRAYCAERAYGDTYDAIVTGPSYVDEETWKAMQRIMREPRKPLPGDPIPIMEPLGLLGSLWRVLKGRRVYAR